MRIRTKEGHPPNFSLVDFRTDVSMGELQDISGLLIAWSNGDQEALKGLMSLVYPELRKIARQHLGRQAPQHTLDSAALANEAYLRLIRVRAIQYHSQ